MTISAAKERKSNEDDEVALPTITTPRICVVLDTLKTIGTFFSCTPEVDDTTFEQINILETSVFNQTLSCLTKKGMDDYLKPGLSK